MKDMYLPVQAHGFVLSAGLLVFLNFESVIMSNKNSAVHAPGRWTIGVSARYNLSDVPK